MTDQAKQLEAKSQSSAPATSSPQAQDNALVWAMSLDRKGSGVAINDIDLGTVRVAADPQSASQQDQLHWLHFQSDHPSCRQSLLDLGVDAHIANIITATATRPRAIEHEKGILLLLRGVNANPGSDPEDMVSIRIWLEENLVVTARRSERRIFSAQDVRDQLLEGAGPSNTGELLARVSQQIAHRIEDVVDEFEAELMADEAQFLTGNIAGLRQKLADTRRKTAEIRRYVAPQRDALDGLLHMRPKFIENNLYAIRESSDRTTRNVEDLDLIRERAILLQDEVRNTVAEQQNQRMYVLSIVTTIFLPLSFLTGVFGMNVGGLPGVESVRGFVWVSAIMLATAVGVLIWLKSKKWL